MGYASGSTHPTGYISVTGLDHPTVQTPLPLGGGGGGLNAASVAIRPCPAAFVGWVELAEPINGLNNQEA